MINAVIGILGFVIILFGLHGCAYFRYIILGTIILLIGTGLVIYRIQVAKLWKNINSKTLKSGTTTVSTAVTSAGFWKVLFRSAVIVGIILFSVWYYRSRPEVFYFTPNQWNKVNFGWQEIFIPPDTGEYLISVSGNYEQWFSDDRKTEYWVPIYPDGIRKSWVPPYADKLPCKEVQYGYSLIKINDQIIPIGYGNKVYINGGSKVYFSPNINQNYVESGHPSIAFKFNRGVMQIKIRKL